MCSLALSNSGPKYVGVIAVVVSKLEFGNVQMEVLLAHLMERPDDAALNNGPKALNRLGMNNAMNVFMRPMIDGLMVCIRPRQVGYSQPIRQCKAS
jgi:hypothetical protein